MNITVKLFFDFPVKFVFTVFNHLFAIAVQNDHCCLSAILLMFHQEKLLSIYDDIVCRCPFSQISFNLIISCIRCDDCSGCLDLQETRDPPGIIKIDILAALKHLALQAVPVQQVICQPMLFLPKQTRK